MTRKSAKTPASGARSRMQWRPHNALTSGVASRESWSKTAGKGSRNPRGRKPKRAT
jgi:hypothetical protein